RTDSRRSGTGGFHLARWGGRRLCITGGDCRHSCACNPRGRNRLETDCCALRSIVAGAAIAGGRTESRSGGGDGGGSGRRPASARRPRRKGGVARILFAACGARRFAASLATMARGGVGVSPCARFNE